MNNLVMSEYRKLARERLMPAAGYKEGPDTYYLACPSRACGGGPSLILSVINGSGLCLNEPLNKAGGYRRYSLWEIARLLNIDVSGLYGIFADPKSANMPSTESARAGDSLRGLRADNTDLAGTARRLLQDPWLLHRYLCLASASSIADEDDLLRVLYLAIISRLLGDHRFNVAIGEQPAAGKSALARFALSTVPTDFVLHLGGGASKRALQYSGDLSYHVVFIDEADVLEDELRATIREAVTTSQVNRLVTSGGAAEYITLLTTGMVLIQAGTAIIANPADETRFLQVHPDVSPQQTSRILNMQAGQAATPSAGLDFEIEVWRKAQELLQPCFVTVSFAPALRQFFNANEHRFRRDFPRLLSLIRACACLHQYQRTSYERDGELVIDAELEDYRQIYGFAVNLFGQATRGLTPTRQRVLDRIRQHRRLGQGFATREATEWAGSAYSTVRGHLLDLEELGMVESSYVQGQRLWRIVAETPPGFDLPTPDQLIDALYSQTP